MDTDDFAIAIALQEDEFGMQQTATETKLKTEKDRPPSKRQKTTHNEMRALYHCNYCKHEIKGVRIRCGTCADFDLCVDCFSVGVEVEGHKNDHPYRVMVCSFLSFLLYSCLLAGKPDFPSVHHGLGSGGRTVTFGGCGIVWLGKLDRCKRVHWLQEL